MARVRDIELHEVPEGVQPIYKQYAEEFKSYRNQVKVFGHRPPALKHIMSMLLEFAAEDIVPKRYMEIALVVVSKLNECRYCVAHHTPQAIIHGVSPQAVANILDEKIEEFDDVDMLVRDFAVQVTNNFQYMRDRIFIDMRKHFTEEQIVEFTLRIALCGFFNRVNEVLQIEMEDGVVEDMIAQGASVESLP